MRAEAEQLEEAHADADEIPEEVDQRLGEIETAIAAIEERPVSYDPVEIARAGAFVSIDGSGRLRVERGYVRPEDEASLTEPEAPDQENENETSASPSSALAASKAVAPNGGAVQSEPAEDEDEGLRPLPDKLLTELTAYRTLALREAVGNDPGVAFLRGAACSLPKTVLPLRLRLLSGDRTEIGCLRRSSPGTWRYAARN